MATATTTTQPLPQFQPYQNDYWSRAQEVANTPYEQGPGTYVGPNQTMQDGWAAIQNRAINGNPTMSAASQGLQGFYGQQQQGATQNPYGPVTAGSNWERINAGQRTGNINAGQQTGNINAGGRTAGISAGSQTGGINAGNNNMQVQGGYNPYASHQNPYLSQQIDQAQGDVVRNWNNVQKPSWDSLMAGSGSFGNANIQQAAQNAQSDLQQNLGRISSDMRMGAYNQAAGLTESGLNRDFNAQQFNTGTRTDNLNRQMSAQQFNAGLGESFAGRQMDARQFNAGLSEAYNGRNFNAQQFNAGLGESFAGRRMDAQQFNAGLSEAYAGRGMDAQQFNSNLRGSNLDRQYNAQTFNANQGQDWAGRNDSMYGQNQSRMLQAYGMAPGFANQDYVDANALMGVGQQMQTFDQNQQNQNNDWWNQSRNYAGQQLDQYGQRLGMMQGGQQSTQNTGNPSTSSQIIGGAVAGAGLGNWWNSMNMGPQPAGARP